MEECPRHGNLMIITHQQSAGVAQPGKWAFHLPTVTVSPQDASVVERGFFAPATMRADQQNASTEQSPSQWIAVVSTVGHHSQRTLLGMSATGAGHGNRCQSALGQRHFPRRGADPLASHRNPFALDPHPPLRAFAPLGFANAVAPFLAGAKLPSRKVWLQSNLPRLSSRPRKRRPILSQTFCSSHRRNRRQQGQGLGYSLGKSRQRAPVLSTQRMPSSTQRLSAQGRPLLCNFGSNGLIRFHCLSDKNVFCIPYSLRIDVSCTSTKCYKKLTYETASTAFGLAEARRTPLDNAI